LSVSYIPNSIEARDVATLVHMQTNLRKHQTQGPHVIMRGQGCRVFDDSGRDYIDAVAGLWCASLGFGSERLAQVAAEQMRKLGYYHLYRHRSNEPAVALAETLLKIAPVPMARVVFQCSGSEANDTAIKLAWYYWHAVGQPQRSKIIARKMAYHGNTCAAVSLSGKPDMHAGFGLPFAPFKHTEFPHYYRGHHDGESEPEFSARMAQALEALIQAEGPDTIAAYQNLIVRRELWVQILFCLIVQRLSELPTESVTIPACGKHLRHQTADQQSIDGLPWLGIILEKMKFQWKIFAMLIDIGVNTFGE